MDNDTLDFIAYSTVQPSICASGLFRVLVNRYIKMGYTLTRRIPYPIAAPTNVLHIGTEIDEAIRHACDFVRRRRMLNLWRASFSFALHLAQPVPDVITWTLFVWRDIFFSADPNRTKQNTRELVNAVTIAVAMLPTYYGCLTTPLSTYQGDTTAVQTANRYLFGNALPLTTDGNGETN